MEDLTGKVLVGFIVTIIWFALAQISPKIWGIASIVGAVFLIYYLFWKKQWATGKYRPIKLLIGTAIIMLAFLFGVTGLNYNKKESVKIKIPFLQEESGKKEVINYNTTFENLFYL